MLYGRQILNWVAMIQVIIDMLGLCPVKDKIIFPFSSPEWYKYSLLELKSDEGQIRPIIFFFFY